MVAFVILMVLGTVMILLGIVNFRGDLRSLHTYHYHRVTEADRLKFGRLVGLGTILIGVAVMLYGALLLAYEKAKIEFLLPLGLGILFAGLAVGLAISFYAMKKYNKGIF